MRVRLPVSPIAMAAALAAAPLWTAGLAAQEAAWRTSIDDNARDGDTGQMPLPPRLPGAQVSDQAQTSDWRDAKPAGSQADALTPQTWHQRSDALDSGSVFRPQSQQQNDDAEARALRRVVDAPEEDGTVPVYDRQTGAEFARRMRREEEGDPYAPVGIRAGSFIVLPSVELRGGQTVASGEEDTSLLRVEPSVEVRSDWSRHEFTARAALQHERSTGDPASDTSFDAGMGLRLDINRDTVAAFDISYNRDRVSPTDPDLPATALEETEVDELSFTAALSRRFGRFLATLTGSATDYAYGDTQVSGGGPPVDGSEQDYRKYEGALRLDYASTDRIGAFAEAAVNTRDYATDVSSGGLRLGSDGYSVLAGLTFGGEGKLTGEAGVGYQHQASDEPTFGDVDAFLARGNLVWEATALTTFTLTAETEVEDSSSGGYTVYSLRGGIAHALRRNVILTAGIGAEWEDAASTVSVEAGGEYRLNRSLALIGDVTHEHSRSGGDTSDETTMTVGLRLQR